MLSTCHERTSGFPRFSGGRGGAQGQSAARISHHRRGPVAREQHLICSTRRSPKRRECRRARATARVTRSRNLEPLDTEPKGPSQGPSSLLAESRFQRHRNAAEPQYQTQYDACEAPPARRQVEPAIHDAEDQQVPDVGH